MWILFAMGSAFFAGVTSVLAKCGIKETDSNVATAIRTVVVLVFSWLMVFVAGSQKTMGAVDGKTLLFLVLSGLATGASWLCYFKALQIGDINQIVPVDKSSTVMTIFLALVFLGEGITWMKGLAAVLIAAGTFLMIQRRSAEKECDENTAGDHRRKGLFLAFLSAVFASLTSILGKIGISQVESNLGTAIRTVVVLIMAWGIVIITGKYREIQRIQKKELGFISLSGLATGASWLCYYNALQKGPASVVVPIDKLSILVTIAFSYAVFHEKLSKRAAAGLFCMVAGTVALAVLA